MEISALTFKNLSSLRFCEKKETSAVPTTYMFGQEF